METYQKELDLIKTVLRENPKGMTVTDIARKISINRNSVAKYLDILLISGHAEMISFGPAKVYFPSHRIPLSAMLNFVSDYILTVDEHLNIVQVNDAFLSFFNMRRDILLHRPIDTLATTLFNNMNILISVKAALEGKECTEELCLQTEEEEWNFAVRMIPTAFENGRQGATLILTDITEKKRIETALQGERKQLKRESMSTSGKPTPSDDDG